jgi:hypothetical protein
MCASIEGLEFLGSHRTTRLGVGPLIMMHLTGPRPTSSTQPNKHDALQVELGCTPLHGTLSPAKEINLLSVFEETFDDASEFKLAQAPPCCV